MRESRSPYAGLFASCNAAYRVLGQGARTLSDDACVIRVYEAARALGQCAFSLRERDPDVAGENVELAVALGDALRADPSGETVLYVFTCIVGPRLLVSVRDVAESEGPSPAERRVLSGVRTTLVEELLASGRVLEGRDVLEDPARRDRINEITRRLDGSGNAESFGVTG